MAETIDEVEEELDRLSGPLKLNDLQAIDISVLKRPLSRLLSKAALSVDVDATVGDAVRLMRERAYGAVCVTRQGSLAGILSERDLVTRVFGTLDRPLERKVSDVMTPDPVALQADDEIIYACHNLHVGGYRHLPVVDAQYQPVSIVSIKDVFRYLLGFFHEEVSNVTGEPFRGPRMRDSA